VPIVQDGDLIISQNVAIWHYLCTKTAQIKDCQLDLSSQIKILQWLAFINSDIHPTFLPLFDELNYLAPKDINAAKANAIKKLQSLFGIIGTHLNNKKWLAATPDPTFADAYAFVVLRWTQALHLNLNFIDNLQFDLAQIPNLADFMHRFADDKSVQKVMHKEGLLY